MWDAMDDFVENCTGLSLSLSLSLSPLFLSPFLCLCFYLCLCLCLCVSVSLVEKCLNENIKSFEKECPRKCSLFLCIIFNMKSLSNLIFKTKSNGIMIDRDFILKTMQKKKVSISGELSCRHIVSLCMKRKLKKLDPKKYADFSNQIKYIQNTKTLQSKSS